MLDQDSALITSSLQDVEFLDHKTPNFMFPCCSVLTR